jgi:hypothetical protein
MLYDHEVWPTVNPDDLWIFDKLILSRKLGYPCGPSGVAVPQPGYYVVRPCVNLAGMGTGASIKWLNNTPVDAWVVPAGYFWQERFVGRHLSVDYQSGRQLRCTEGVRHGDDLTRFHHWFMTDDQPRLPKIVQDIVDRYKHVNVEMIDGKIIEVHLRGNPDFDDGAVEIIPVWRDEKFSAPPSGFDFVPAPDFERLGFFKRYRPL